VLPRNAVGKVTEHVLRDRLATTQGSLPVTVKPA